MVAGGPISFYPVCCQNGVNDAERVLVKEICTSIDIDSPAALVWDILTDLKNYSTWNSFIPKAQGDLRPGGSLKITIRPPGREAQDYRVRILEVETERRLRWLGHFHVPGLIDGDHWFELRVVGPNTTHLVQRECFRGIVVPLTWKRFLDTHLRAGFETLNRELKAAAERAARQRHGVVQQL